MKTHVSGFQLFWDRAGMLVVFALLFTGCALFVDGFFSRVNMESILLSVSTIGIIACTMLFCLAAGAFDLSIGSTVACTGVVTAVVINRTGSVTVGVLAGLATGALVGLGNGLLIARAGINALIATLATMQIVRGLGYKVSGGKSVGVINEDFFLLGNSSFLGLPVPVWICLGCFLLFGFLIERTVFGRNTLALGGNPEAARLAGIATARLQVVIFTLQGLVAALAGIVLCSRMTSGQPMVAQGLELDVISACVLGGVSLTGGIGRMSYVIAGVLIMGTVRNAMNLLNLQTFDQYIASGLILLAAVAFDRIKRRGAGR
jgi:L-arabinose transport system permease protein